MSITFKPQLIQDEHILRVYDSMYLFDKLRSCVDFHGESIQHYFYHDMMIFNYIDQANQIKWFACFPLHVIMQEEEPCWMMSDNAYVLFPKGSEFVEALVPDSKGQARKVTAEHLSELYRQVSNVFDVPTLSFNADGDTLLQPHIVGEITGESIPKVIYMYHFGDDLITELAVDSNTAVRCFGRYIYCLREKEATLDAIEAYNEIDIERIMSLNRDNILDAFIRDLFDSCRFKAKRLWKIDCGVAIKYRNVNTFDGSVVSQIVNSTMESVTQHFLAVKNVGKLKDK